MGERKYLVTQEELTRAIEEAETIGIPFSQKGAANGVATLDGEEHLTLAQVPPPVASSSGVVVYADSYYEGAAYASKSASLQAALEAAIAVGGCLKFRAGKRYTLDVAELQVPHGFCNVILDGGGGEFGIGGAILTASEGSNGNILMPHRTAAGQSWENVTVRGFGLDQQNIRGGNALIGSEGRLLENSDTILKEGNLVKWIVEDCYSVNVFTDTTPQGTREGEVTEGSRVIKGLPNTTQVCVGALVECEHMPINNPVTAVLSATEIEVKNPATGTGKVTVSYVPATNTSVSLNVRAEVGGGTEYKVVGCRVRRCDFQGGNAGVRIIAEAANRTTGNLNISVDDNIIEDCKHDTLVVNPTLAYSSANFYLTSEGYGGFNQIIRCKGSNSGDVGAETDSNTLCFVTDCDIKDAYNANYYHTNYGVPGYAGATAGNIEIKGVLVSGEKKAKVKTLAGSTKVQALWTLTPGMPVAGEHVPAGTTVAAVLSKEEVELSNAAEASGEVTLTLTPWSAMIDVMCYSGCRSRRINQTATSQGYGYWTLQFTSGSYIAPAIGRIEFDHCTHERSCGDVNLEKDGWVFSGAVRAVTFTECTYSLKDITSTTSENYAVGGNFGVNLRAVTGPCVVTVNGFHNRITGKRTGTGKIRFVGWVFAGEEITYFVKGVTMQSAFVNSPAEMHVLADFMETNKPARSNIDGFMRESSFGSWGDDTAPVGVFLRPDTTCLPFSENYFTFEDNDFRKLSEYGYNTAFRTTSLGSTGCERILIRKNSRGTELREGKEWQEVEGVPTTGTAFQAAVAKTTSGGVMWAGPLEIRAEVTAGTLTAIERARNKTGEYEPVANTAEACKLIQRIVEGEWLKYTYSNPNTLKLFVRAARS
jgi:hypothetical protein